MENNKKRAEDAGEMFMERITAVVVPAINDMETSLGKVKEVQEKLAAQMDGIKMEVVAFKDILQNIEIKTAPTNTAAFEVLANGWYQKIVRTLDAFPKKHSFRILFFPEHDALGYLKKLWRGVFLLLFFTILVTCLYSLGNKWVDNHAESQYRNGWETLYDSQSKTNKKMMDDILSRQ